MTASTARRRGIRTILGLLVSAVFIVVTVSRVDLAEVGVALGKVSPAGLVLAIPIVLVELVLRGLRWQRLLQPIAPVSLRESTAYLAIGYFANSMLPARLGDVARAHLAGRAFDTSRLAVLGTIVVERLADGAFILAVVAALGLTVAAGASLVETAFSLGILAILGLAALGVALMWLRRPNPTGIRATIRPFIDRVVTGVAVVRAPAIAIPTMALTVAAFGAAVATFAIVAEAAGAELSLAESALVMGGLALSTSIPAGPGSIGTYEFVGLTIMTALGLDPESALAIAVLVHLVATIPVALAGLVAAWQLHFRFSQIAEDAEPSRLAS